MSTEILTLTAILGVLLTALALGAMTVGANLRGIVLMGAGIFLALYGIALAITYAIIGRG